MAAFTLIVTTHPLTQPFSLCWNPQGVKLLFADHTTGVMLLNVPGSIPSSFKVYMAGVSAVADAAPRAGACIQHPGGGGARIATAAGPCASQLNPTLSEILNLCLILRAPRRQRQAHCYGSWPVHIPT